MRDRIIAANWKMNGTLEACRRWSKDWQKLGKLSCRTVLCAPAVYLTALAELTAGTGIELGGEDASEHASGAYTGETAAGMLADIGMKWCIVGHSERRSLFGDDDLRVAKKAAAIAAAGLAPILCVGETLKEREAGDTEAVILRQLDAVLAAVPAERLGAVAYEPVWAIGTGRTAAPEDAQAVHAAIRARIAEASPEAAQKLPILYGGSVNPKNAAGLFAMPDIDGALVGGASLKAESFHQIGEAFA